jgi:hypothetical protein
MNRTEPNRTELTFWGTEPNFELNFLSTRSNHTALHCTALGGLFGSIGSIANTECVVSVIDKYLPEKY